MENEKTICTEYDEELEAIHNADTVDLADDDHIDALGDHTTAKMILEAIK